MQTREGAACASRVSRQSSASSIGKQQGEELKPRYTLRGHARRKMIRRRIPEAAIEYVLENHDSRRPAPPRPGTGEADVLSAEYEGRRLSVYVVRGAYPYIIKTVAWEEPE